MHLTECNCESMGHLYCPYCQIPIEARSSAHQLQMELPAGCITIGASFAKYSCLNCGQVSETRQAVRSGRLYLVAYQRGRWQTRNNYCRPQNQG
jgi:hypothetical protein